MDASQRSDSSAVVPGGEFVAGAAKYPDDIPLVAAEGSGPYLRTRDGTEYVDYVLGGGPLLVGHTHPRVVEAMQAQVERGSTFYVPSDEGFSLAERIVDAVPCADQLKFTSTGAEATYFAIRIARAYTGNETIMKFGGAYHGFHDYALQSSSYANSAELLETTYPETTVDSAGIISGASESVIAGRYNDLENTTEIVEQYGDELAAIIVEPMMRTLPPKDGFLEGVRALCDEHDIVLIFDEVVTGFRLAWGGSQEHYGVEPDLATYGKAIGGGTPIAAVCGREELMSLTDPARPKSEGGTYVSGTLSGNPLCAAAGNATLDILEERGTYESLHAYADDFRELITDLLADSSLSGVTLGDGPLVDYAITDEPEITHWDEVLRSDSETVKKIDKELLKRGILQMHGGKRYVSTEHGDEEMEQTEEAFKEAVEVVA